MPAEPSENVRDDPLEEMDRVVDINLRGTMAATQATLKHMKSGVASS